MRSRFGNLINAVADSTGGIGAFGLSVVGCLAYGGLFVVYERSYTTTSLSLAVFCMTLLAALTVYLNGLSHGSNKEERAAAVAKYQPLMVVALNTGIFLSFLSIIIGDAAVEYFSANTQHLIVALGASFSMAAVAVVSAFSWVFLRFRHIDGGLIASGLTEVVERVEVSEAKAPSTSLRYSEKDRKRKAAHFAGRVMCFAGSPYLNDDFSFEINEEFAQITYREEDTFPDEDFLYWMVFQLLCAQQAEVAFAKKTSKISWEHYGDIEHYATEILASRPGASRILRDPQTVAELDWRAKRIRFFVKETIPRVHSFLRANQESLKRLTRLTLSGSLDSPQLHAELRSVDTAHLPGHWDEAKSGGNHLSLVSS